MDKEVVKITIPVTFSKRVFDTPNGEQIPYIDVTATIQGADINLKKVNITTFNLIKLLQK